MVVDLRYGDFRCDRWQTVKGVDDPILDRWIEAIRPYLVGYELWIYGGVLEGWDTNDIDGTIKGPHNPLHINWMLENIARITLEEGLFPDIKYSMDGNMFLWSEWLESREYVTCKYAYYKPYMLYNKRLITWGTLQDGLWVANRTWPLKKQEFSGHNYKDPIRII